MKKLQANIALAVSGLAFVLGTAGNALAQSDQHAQHGAASPAAAQQTNMSGHEMMQSMQDMHKKMSNMEMTGNQDHDFAMMMRSHHQAGLDMANAELKNGKDKQLKQMAKKIVSAQTKEIKELDQWMANHPAPRK